MARRVYVFREDEQGNYIAVEVTEAPRVERSGSNFIGDDIPPTFNHVDCKYYTSKSRMRAENKARGFIELGNERPQFKKPEFNEQAFERDFDNAVKHLGC